jgi:glycosyltransferase involved in cell wall biosynthesis
MKIAFFTDQYWPRINGVSVNLEAIKRQFEKMGHEVFIVAPKAPGYKDKDPNIFRLSAVKIVKDPEQKVVIPIPEKDLRRLLRRKFDMVHAHSLGTSGFLGWEIARLRDIPYVITYHTLLNRYTHYIFKGMLVRPKAAEVGSRIFCNLADLIIAPTQRVKKELLAYGVKREILTIPGGLEQERFQNVERGFLRNMLGIDENKKIILYLGRIGTEKNIEFLIKSLSGILKKRKEAYFVIAGDGPERKNLEKLVKDMNLDKKILFTGVINHGDVPKAYTDSDIFVFASTTETQGLTLPEAMSSGLVPVVIEDQAFEEAVFDGKTGFIAKPTEADFAKKVERLLEDEDLRRKIGQAAKEFASEEYSVETQAKQLIKAYEKAVKINASSRKVTRILRSRFTATTRFLRLNVAFTKFKEAMKSLEKI